MGRTELEKMGNKFIVLSEGENDRWAARIKTASDDYVKASKAERPSGRGGAEVL